MGSMGERKKDFVVGKYGWDGFWCFFGEISVDWKMENCGEMRKIKAEKEAKP